MREVSWGGLRARITGGTDRQGGGDGPLVVLLHGFGAPGDDLVPLSRVLDVPSEVRFLFPEAPLSLGGFPGGDARAWWMIDIDAIQRHDRDRTREYPEGLPPAREAVRALLDRAQAELGAPGERTVLGGFSQGSMLALDLALHDDRPLAALALLSSTLIAQDHWLPRMPARAGLPVLQSHGRADPLLPFDMAERLRDELRTAGLPVTFVPFQGGHAIPGDVLDALGQLITEHAG